ncbi:hypothetical protein KVR01_002374 [Diaporthe batatas]|uniref:uncharacterized protein n=1 Tax=Diaporthe batatas TaxID=748121 RepID=UPI001D03A513|nr:uncharacterized protein KVR01_002374 [Diaporthe batatas]KAG8166685.1 hypothetical protein KVR01_002374 [Diaporthe batatas]
MSPDLPPHAMTERPGTELVVRGSTSSTTDGRSLIEGLPNEVLIKIAQSVEGKNKVPILLSLCLVSKQMDSVARKPLYQKVIIESYLALTKLYRALRKNKALGPYIEELEMLVPGFIVDPDYLDLIDDDDFVLQCSHYVEVLKRTPQLKTLNLVLLHLKGTSRPFDTCLTPQMWDEFISKLSDAITLSQEESSATAILPLLEEVRLGTDRFFRIGMEQPMVLLPFLQVPSMARIEMIGDSGLWPGISYPLLRNATRASPIALGAHQFKQVKSVILTDSHCLSSDIMDACKIFPNIEVFFCQHCIGSGTYKMLDSHRFITEQHAADPSEKRYLTKSFTQLKKLQSLALVPIMGEPIGPDWCKIFIGPDGFLNLTRLPALTSVAAVITLFAYPQGQGNGHLTPSPMEILPRSLQSLQIIVDPWTGRVLHPYRTPLNTHWFQPREAALRFLNTLASTCAKEFPDLRHVEYIWAVDRNADAKLHADFPGAPSEDTLCRLADGSFGVLWAPRRCPGMRPLCCEMHTRIQALSPDEDYYSRAAKFVSPFKDRFDALGAAFEEANVVFRIVELVEYDEFYDHWKAGRDLE